LKFNGPRELSPPDKEGFISGSKAFPKGFYEGPEVGPVGILSSYDAARITNQTILVPFGKGTPSLACNRLWQINHLRKQGRG
jgi:hypothetical protein